MSQEPRYVTWQRIPAVEASTTKNPAHAQPSQVAHRQPARTHIAKITYSQEDHLEQVAENMHSVRTVVESVKLSPDSGGSRGRLEAGDSVEKEEFVRKKQERDREIQDIQSMLNHMLQQQSNMQQQRDQQRFEGKQQQQREADLLKDQQQQREWQLIQQQQQMQQQQLLHKQEQQQHAQVTNTERRSPRKDNKTQIKSIPRQESGDGRGIHGSVVNETFSLQHVTGAATSIPEFNLNISPMATSTRHRPATRSARSSSQRSKSTQPSATNCQEPDQAEHTDRKKFYDPVDARRFMKEQRLKRRSKSLHQFTDPAQKSAHEKEMIKKRLQELRDNTVKILQKNMEKKKKKTVTIASAASTARSETTAKRPEMTQRSKSEVVVVKKTAREANEPQSGAQPKVVATDQTQFEKQQSDEATQTGRDPNECSAKESQAVAKQSLRNSVHSQGNSEPSRNTSDRSQQTPQHIPPNPQHTLEHPQPTADLSQEAGGHSQESSERDPHSRESPESHPVPEHTYPVQPPPPQQRPLVENQKRVGLLRKPDTKEHSFSAIREFSFDKENVALEMLTPKVSYPGRQPPPEESKTAESAKSLDSAVADGESDLKRCNLEIPSAKLTSRNSSSSHYRGSSLTSDSARPGSCRTEDARERERNFSQHRSELPFWLKPSTVQVYPYNFIMAVRRKLEAISNAQHSHDNCQHQNVGTETCNHQTTSTGDLAAETPVGRGAQATAEAQTHVRRRRIIEECLKHASESEESMLTHTMGKRLPHKKTLPQRTHSVERLPEVAPPPESANEPVHHSPDSQVKSQTYSELNSNLSSISVQLPPSNTVSEVSSIQTEAIPKSRTKTASRRSQRRLDDDTTASSSVLTSPEKKLKDDFKFLAPRPVSPLCLERVEQLRITSKSAEKGAEEGVVGSKVEAGGDIDFTKLLDDFNRSLSQVIQVNEQLKSTLDKSHRIYSPTSSRPSAKKTSHSDEYSQDFEEETNPGAKQRSEDVQKVLEQRLGDLLANVQKDARAQSKGPLKPAELPRSPAASGATTRSSSKCRTPSKSIDEYTEDIEEVSRHEKPSKSSEKRRRSHSLAKKEITVYLTTSPPHQHRPQQQADEGSPLAANELDLKFSTVSPSRTSTVATETFSKTPSKSIDEYTEEIRDESADKSYTSHRRKLFGARGSSQNELKSIDDYTEDIADEQPNFEAAEENEEAPEHFEQPLLLIEQMKASLTRAIKNSQANRSPPESKSERSVQFDEEQLSILAKKSQQSKRSSKRSSETLSASISTSEAANNSPAPSTEIDGKEGPSPNVGSRTFLVKASPSSGSPSPAKSITEDLQNHRESPSEANEKSPFTNSMSMSRKEKDESFIKSHVNTSRGDFLEPEELGDNRKDLSEDFASNNAKDSSGKSRESSENSKDFCGKSKDCSIKEKSFSGKSKDSSIKEKDSSFKEKDFSGTSKDSSIKEKDFSGMSKDSSIKEKDFSGKSKDFSGKSKDSSIKEKDFSGTSKASSDALKESSGNSKERSKGRRDCSGDSQDISGRSEYFSSKSKYLVGRSDDVSGNSATLVEQLPTSGRRTSASATQLTDKTAATSNDGNIRPRRPSSLTASPRKSSKSLNISSSILNQTDLDITIFSNVSDSSLNYSNVGLYEKLIRNETTKSEQLTALLKMREKALFDRTRGQIALLEVQKERYKAKGLVGQMAAVKKKQRAILLKMEREREELKRLLQSTSTTNSTESSHRSNHPARDQHKSPRPPSKNRSPQPAALLPPPIQHPKSVRHTPPQESGSIPASGDLVRQSSSAPIVRATYALESSRPLEELLQKREADLQRRRAHVERLMQWHRRLDQEEAEVLQLEQMLLQYNCSQPPPQPPNDEPPADLKGSASANTTTKDTPRTTHQGEEVTPADSRLLLSEQELSPQEKRAAKMERRIKEIDRSLRKLSSISTAASVPPLSGSPGTTSGGPEGDESPQDYVRTSGAKLNKLWRRLTSQQVEKFEPLQRYKLGKADLERLYEEAKVAVLQDFAQNEERLAVELLEKSSQSNLSQSESCPSVGGQRVNNVRVPLLNLSGSSAAPSDIDEDLLVGQAQGNYSPSAAEEDFQLRSSQSKSSSSDYSEDGEQREASAAAKFARNMQAFAALSHRVSGGQAGQLHRSLSDPSLQQLPLMLFATTSNQNVYSGESRSTIKTDPASGSGATASGRAPVSGSGSAPVSGSGSAPVSGSGSAPVSGSGSAPISGSGSAPASGSGSAAPSGSGSGSFVSASAGATSYATTMDGVQSERSEAPASSNIPSTRIDSAASSSGHSGKASPTISSIASLSHSGESLASAKEAKESTSSGTLVHASEVKEVIEPEEAKELTPPSAEAVSSASLPKSAKSQDSQDSKSAKSQDSQISEKLQEISSALSELSQANSIPLPYQHSRSTTSKEAESDASYSSNFENTATEKQSPSSCTLKNSSGLSSQVIEEVDEVISGSGKQSLDGHSKKATMECSTPTKGSKESRGEQYEADFESHGDTSSINSANTTCIDDLSMPQFESSLEITQNGLDLPEAHEEEALKSPVRGGVKPANTLVEEGVTMLPLTPPPPPPPAPSFSNDTPRPNITSNSPNAQAVPDILNELEIRRCQQILIENEQQKQYEQVTAVPYIPYMREIPNKPPPPYVPPAHGSPMTTIFPSEERIKDITYRRAHELFCELIKTDYTNAKGEKLPSVMEEKITNIYERIILDICREYLAENREVLTRGDPTNFHSQLAFFNPPDRVRCVQESIYKEVRRCLAMDKTSPKRTQVYSVYGQRAKRDHIGKIIIQEMYDEDDRWCNFHREEHEVLDLIIEEMINSNVEEIAKEVYVAEGGVLEDEEQNESSSARRGAGEESTNGEVDSTNEELGGTGEREMEEKHDESTESKENVTDSKTESSETAEKSAEQISENIEESESLVKSPDAKAKESSPVRYYGCGGISLAEELRRANEALAITEPNNSDDSPISTTVVE